MISIYNDIIKERNENSERETLAEKDKYNIGSLKNRFFNQSQPKVPNIKVPKLK